jgi:hypothetical protein
MLFSPCLTRIDEFLGMPYRPFLSRRNLYAPIGCLSEKRSSNRVVENRKFLVDDFQIRSTSHLDSRLIKRALPARLMPFYHNFIFLNMPSGMWMMMSMIHFQKNGKYTTSFFRAAAFTIPRATASGLA